MLKKNCKVLFHNKEYKFEKHGNWIDLATAEDYSMSLMEYKLLSLGISIEMPKWYKGEIKPRSSCFKNFGIIQTNSPAEIETEYCGYNDIWRFTALCLSPKGSNIPKNSRIAQFQVKLREDAPWYMKILDLFTKISFVEVDVLHGQNRGGIGSTGTSVKKKSPIGYEPHI